MRECRLGAQEEGALAQWHGNHFPEGRDLPDLQEPRSSLPQAAMRGPVMPPVVSVNSIRSLLFQCRWCCRMLFQCDRLLFTIGAGVRCVVPFQHH